MGNIQDEMDQRERNEMTAKRRQEYYENIKEFQNVLFRYNGPTVISPDYVLFSGDYVTKGAKGISSVRGVDLGISAEKFMEQVHAGGFSQVFSPTDLNAPDIITKFERIMKQIKRQSTAWDATIYLTNAVEPHSTDDIALYKNEHDEIEAHMKKKQDEDTVLVYIGAPSEKDMTGMRECTYEEFNPGGLTLHLEIEDHINPERTNKGSAYEKLNEQLNQTGNGEFNKPMSETPDTYERDAILKDSSKSSYEKLMAYNDMEQQIEEQQAQMAEQMPVEQNEEFDGPLGSRMSRYI